jgi:hypothetical protein
MATDPLRCCGLAAREYRVEPDQEPMTRVGTSISLTSKFRGANQHRVEGRDAALKPGACVMEITRSEKGT